MKLGKLPLALGLIFILPACSTTKPSIADTSDMASVAESNGHRPSTWINVTPLSRLIAYRSATPSGDYSSAYTRLIISSVNCSNLKALCAKGGVVKKFDYTQRNWIYRFFWGIRNSITFSAKVTAGEFEATVPLVTLDHVSNTQDGESFSRTVYHMAEDFPLFLIKKDSSNAVISMKFSVRVSSETKSNVTGAVIQAAQAVAKVASPQSAVLTALTEQRTKDLAKAVDNTVSAALATNVEEQQWVDNDIRHWDNEKGVAATFSLPPEGTYWQLDDTPDEVGSWFLGFASPRPSIFSDYQICEPDKLVKNSRCIRTFSDAAIVAQRDSDNRPLEVLGFQLFNNTQNVGTIASFLKQQDWWIARQLDFAKFVDPLNPIREPGLTNPWTPALVKPELMASVRSFCLSIKGAIIGLNLNSVDAGIVSMAVSNSGLVSEEVARVMRWQEDACGHARTWEFEERRKASQY